jgi:hypothetical protein
MGQARQVGLSGANFGLLEHPCETRFHVPKITFIVTPPFSKHLTNKAISDHARSKNARIRASGISWVKFQNSPSFRPPKAHTTLLSKSPTAELESSLPALRRGRRKLVQIVKEPDHVLGESWPALVANNWRLTPSNQRRASRARSYTVHLF